MNQPLHHLREVAFSTPSSAGETSVNLAAAVEAHYDELKSFIAARVACPSLASDIVQDLWLRAAAAAPVEPIRNVRAYLYGVARNLITDRLRQERLRQAAPLDESVAEQIASAAPGADAVLAARQDLRALDAAIGDLPPKCREVFLLHRGEGLSMREIALRLGISERTVEKHIAKALDHCRRRLDRERPRRLGGYVAAAMASVAAAVAWLATGGFDSLRSDYVTGRGEVETVTLADGSTVTLNADTAIAVDLSAGARRVTLYRGEALFEVTPDRNRPFTVTAPEADVRVLGTGFDLKAEDGVLQVGLIHGSIAVTPDSTPRQPLVLRPGEQVRVDDRGAGTVTRFDPTAALAWRRHQAVFYRASLGEVVDTLNRHRHGTILLLDETIRRREVSGVFDLRAPDAALDAIARTLDLRIRRVTDYLVLLD
jgi:transmembrane sensor